MTSDWYAPNQQAVRADESGPAEEGTGGSPEAASAEPSLGSLTKAELLAEAQAQGVEADESMTKAEIQEAIEAG